MACMEFTGSSPQTGCVIFTHECVTLTQSQTHRVGIHPISRAKPGRVGMLWSSLQTLSGKPEQIWVWVCGVTAQAGGMSFALKNRNSTTQTVHVNRPYRSGQQ
jgi:hypothetical protein